MEFMIDMFKDHFYRFLVVSHQFREVSTRRYHDSSFLSGLLVETRVGNHVGNDL